MDSVDTSFFSPVGGCPHFFVVVWSFFVFSSVGVFFRLVFCCVVTDKYLNCVVFTCL